MTTRKLELTDEDLRVLNDALMEMPYYRAAPVVAKINEQLHQQLDRGLPSPEIGPVEQPVASDGSP